MGKRQSKVFLCYSSDDKPAVRDLYNRLGKVVLDEYRAEPEIKMFTRNFIASALCVVACAMTALAQAGQPAANRDPEKVKFVTSDIDNFWRAFDLALKETDREKKIAIFQQEYLDKGSAGLRDFVRLRIKSAKDLAATVEKLPRFYASVRPGTLRAKAA